MKQFIKIIVLAIVATLVIKGYNINHANAQGISTEEFLKHTDAFLDKSVNSCSNPKLTDEQFEIDSCLRIAESQWHYFCKTHYHDKLDTCKNGKLENYLKEHGEL